MNDFNITTFWDLTHEQRATLTDEDITRYIDLERMSNGVVRPPTPILKTVTTPEIPKKLFFEVYFSSYSSVGIAFSNPEDAAAFIALNPIKVETDYRCRDISWAKSIRAEMNVKEIQLATEQNFINHKDALQAAASATEENEKATKTFHELNEKVTDIIDKIHEQCRESRQIAGNRDALRAKWTEYVELCKNDESIAFTFLRKSYTETEIAEALSEEKYGILITHDEPEESSINDEALADDEAPADGLG